MTLGITPVICFWLKIRCGSGVSGKGEVKDEAPLVCFTSWELPPDWLWAFGRLEFFENVTFKTPMYLKLGLI